MKILVVEDDPSVRTLVKAVLEHNGQYSNYSGNS